MDTQQLDFLVIEDEEADFLLLQRYLKGHFPGSRCRRVASRPDLKAALEAGGWDVVLSDYTVPGMHFREGKDLVLTHSADLPFILVSGSVGEEQSVELVKQGVWDFVLKDNMVRLASVIKRGLEEAGERRARREAERRLQASENKYRTLVENIPQMIFAKDIHLTYLSCNERYARSLGIRAEEIAGRTDDDFFSREAAERIRAEDRRIMESGKMDTIEEQVVREGRETWTQIIKTPIRTEDGTVSGILGISWDITDRKMAELKQREGANIIRNIIESSPDSIFVKDRSLRMVLCNKVLAGAVGKEPEDLYGRTDIENGWNPDVVKGNPEKGIPGWEQDDLAALQGKSVRSSQEPSSFGEETRYFDTVKVPLRDEGGTIIGVLGIGRDVTEQRKAEDERKRLQTSLERERTLLLTLINSLPDMVYIKDRESRFILGNRAIADFMGAGDPSGLVGKTDHDFYPAEAADSFRAMEKDVIEGGRALVNHDERNTSASGATRSILTTKVPYHDEGGTIAGLVGIGRDITDREEAAQKLQEQAELLDISSDAIMVCDVEGRILYWNKGAEKIYGWNERETRGRLVRDLLFPTASAEESEKSVRSVIENGTWSGEFRQVAKDGRALVIEATLTLVRRGENKPTGVLVVGTDVTERRSIQAQLLRVQRLESLGTLASGIAHDLNNVLSPILMGVEGLALQKPDHGSRRILEIIKTAAERGASIVHQVLGFAKGMEGARAHVQVAHVVREIGQIIHETFPKSVDIRIESQKDLWPVMGDATQLHQVLMNLCVNARDAMPEGGTLILSTRNAELDEAFARTNIEARPIRYAVLQVRDTGIGMTPGTMEKIFDPFFSTKEPGKGTGLGLSTTRTIVKSHGGFINVQSEPGNGSTFSVFIPAATDTAAKSEKVTEGIPMGEGELVLIVDDEAPVREIARQILESYGYVAITAADGAQALAVYAERRGTVRIVLTDIAMPYMDGTAMIRALRKADPGARIIATSGMAVSGEEHDARSLGVDAFLPKPFTAESLLGVLREVLSRGS